MLQGLLNRVQAGIDRLVSKLAGRAAVAVCFVIAGGFAAAALTVKLSQEFGAATAYLVLAGLFALIGGIVAVAVRTNGAGGELAEAAPAPSDVARDSRRSSLTDGLDRETITALLSTAAPVAAPVVIRAIFGRWPLLALLLVMAAYLFLTASPAAPKAAAPPVPAE